MGVGTFALMISVLPGRVLRMLEFVGMQGDKVHLYTYIQRKNSAKTSGTRHVISQTRCFVNAGHVTLVALLDDFARVASESLFRYRRR